MGNNYLWFLVAFGLMALEMASGTFYMLVLGLAFAVGGMLSLLEYSAPVQFTAAAISGVVGTLILQIVRRGKPLTTQNQSLDVGQPIQSVSWHDDGTARVVYRGTEWDADPENADTPHELPLYIKEIRGSRLVLSKHKTRS